MSIYTAYPDTYSLTHPAAYGCAIMVKPIISILSELFYLNNGAML